MELGVSPRSPEESGGSVTTVTSVTFPAPRARSVVCSYCCYNLLDLKDSSSRGRGYLDKSRSRRASRSYLVKGVVHNSWMSVDEPLRPGLRDEVVPDRSRVTHRFEGVVHRLYTELAGVRGDGSATSSGESSGDYGAGRRRSGLSRIRAAHPARRERRLTRVSDEDGPILAGGFGP